MTKRQLLVLASTYPRWENDPEPNFVHNLAKRLTNDFDVHVLCPSSPDALGRQILDNVKIHRYRYAPRGLETLVHNGGMLENIKRDKWKALLLPFFFVAQIISATRIIRENQIDVIHAHWIIPQGLALYFVSFFCETPPVLITSHGADLFSLQNRFFTFLKKKAIGKVAFSTVVSKAMLQPFEDLNTNNIPCSVISMGSDLKNVFTIGKQNNIKPKSLIFVGRLVQKKGLMTLVESLPPVFERNRESTLTIIGEGPERDSLESRVSELQLKKNIIFLGAVPHSQLPEHLQKSEFFVAPFEKTESGDQEGLGLVLLEALGCGCKVITSDMDACKDIVENNPNCVTFKAGNVHALSDTLLNALDKQKPYEKDSLNPLHKKYDWHEISEKYREILTSIA